MTWACLCPLYVEINDQLLLLNMDRTEVTEVLENCRAKSRILIINVLGLFFFDGMNNDVDDFNL